MPAVRNGRVYALEANSYFRGLARALLPASRPSPSSCTPISKSVERPNRHFANHHKRADPHRIRLAPHLDLCLGPPDQKEQLTKRLSYIRILYVKGERYDWTGNQTRHGGTGVLSVLEEGPLHGYELARRIEQQTKGALRFTLAALYPMLYRMEQRRWIRGTWETGSNGRRRRCYRLTAEGKKKLSPFAKNGRSCSTLCAADEGVHCLIGKTCRPAPFRPRVGCCREDEVHAELARASGRFLRIAANKRPIRASGDSTKRWRKLRNWPDLRRKILIAKKGRDFMKKRLHQLWIPDSSPSSFRPVFLMTLQKLGFQPRIVGDGPNAILFCAPWLESLLFVGAVGAYLSSRAGGSRGAALIGQRLSCARAYYGVFSLMFPIRLDHRTGHRQPCRFQYCGHRSTEGGDWLDLSAGSRPSGGRITVHLCLADGHRRKKRALG